MKNMGKASAPGQKKKESRIASSLSPLGKKGTQSYGNNALHVFRFFTISVSLSGSLCHIICEETVFHEFLG